VRPAPRFPYVRVDARAGDADALVAELFALGAEGVEERDETTLARGPRAGWVRLVASFATEGGAARARAGLAARGVRAGVGAVVGDAWRDKYREHLAPFRFTRSIVVAPPWARPRPRQGTHVLWMDPGRAFGTGLHATTALVGGLLEARRRAVRDARVLDVGTGSGILALASLLLGAREAVAIDSDPDAVAAARHNATLNAVGGRLRVARTPLAKLRGRYQVVVANIEARTLAELARPLCARLAPGGLLFLSGVLEAEERELVARYRDPRRCGARLLHLGTRRRRGGGDGAIVPRRDRRDGWVAIELAREPAP
jgi:ribosomal protein L11 methyltransferase